MGKPIEVLGSTVVDDVLLLDTDRSLTGQDGVGFDSSEIAAATPTFPGRLASRMFAADTGISHVFIASNQVVVGRRGGWDTAAAGATSAAVSGFFVFYAD
ncbi:MAG: hypothetical protein A2Z12_06690 [Actinobacteria bacterium RBG_16_68_21]|nr:MAG: hypothetical protein A2Z12_06690 [Actinobacteria bacterium RBG_16_68_21]